MSRDIRIEQVKNGYILKSWEPKKHTMFDSGCCEDREIKELIASTKDEVKNIVDQWLNEGDPTSQEKQPLLK